MTTPKTLRDEDGREYEVLGVLGGDYGEPTLPHATTARPGDLIVRPAPPPVVSVEEAREAAAKAITRYGEQRQYGHERFTRDEREAGWMAWEAALDALIAAVRREAGKEKADD